MFYFIIFLLILLYYLFMAPDTIKSTLGAIGMVGVLVIGLIFVVALVMTFLGLSLAFYLSLAMTLLGFWAMRDLLKMPSKVNKDKEK